MTTKHEQRPEGRLRRVSVVRAVVEATGPLHVGSGRGDDVSDADVVRDSNGLPTIPGTSLAGVLRARLAPPDAERLFGVQVGRHALASRVAVSFALPLDSQCRPVEGLLMDSSAIGRDPVLAALKQGVFRHHVRLGPAGTADGRGKFDERLTPRGARFLFEVTLSLHDDADGEADDLLRLFETVVGQIARGLHVGGRTRMGLGHLRCVQLAQRTFDLRRSDSLEAYLALPVSLAAEAPGLEAQDLARYGADDEGVRATLALESQAPWGVGGGTPQGDEDIALHREACVVWANGRGGVEERYALPATALKGVLAHRVAFHDNARHGRFLGGTGDAPRFGAESEAVRELFGACVDDTALETQGRGEPGRLRLSDVDLPGDLPSDVIQHNGIDRFTGGTLPGILFSERVLRRRTRLNFELEIERPEGVSEGAKEALRRALRDLERGRLQLGHGHGRGNGWVQGTARWTPAGAAWLGAGRGEGT